MIKEVLNAWSWTVSQHGELTISGATAWITRSGDPNDYVLVPGDTLPVTAGDDLVIEPWRSGEQVELLFRPAGPESAARSSPPPRAPERAIA